MRTFVLVHGAWHGGWCWQAVAERLSACGHRVLAPTLSGLSDRANLLSGSLTLDGWVGEIVDLIEGGRLSDVVLVGHSFGGAVVLGVVDRIPQRIRHLVLLDALVLEDGESPFSVLPPELAEERRRAVIEQGGGIALPVPPVTAFGLAEDHPQFAYVRDRLTPHPASTYESRLTLHHPLGNGRPCTYVSCIDPTYAPLAGSRDKARAQPGWAWLEVATGHDAMITAPDDVAGILSRLA